MTHLTSLGGIKEKKVRLIKDRYYTPYELHKAEILKRKTMTGDTVAYAYETILQMVRKDFEGANEMNIQKRDNVYYILGEDLMKFIKKNYHKFY
jgi:hypothetical protein